MSERPLLVMAAVIEKDGRFLVTQRPDDGRHNGGRWEFPGGKVDFGEDPRYGLEREISEELDIEVSAEDIFELSSNVYSDANKHVVLLACHCVWKSGDISKKDVQDFRWLLPDEMSDYDITEADIPFIEKLQKTKI